jgi:predicted nucleic acid-binding protein
VKGFLLDTNVISEYSRAKPPDERVRRWVDAQDEESLYLSVLALGRIARVRVFCYPEAKGTNWKPGWRQNFLSAFRIGCFQLTRRLRTFGAQWRRKRS